MLVPETVSGGVVERLCMFGMVIVPGTELMERSRVVEVDASGAEEPGTDVGAPTVIDMEFWKGRWLACVYT